MSRTAAARPRLARASGFVRSKPRLGQVQRLLANDGGIAAVEFAMVLPIFIAIVFGIFQIGWAQHKLSTIRFAMERASRGLMIDPNLTEAELRTAVTSRLSSTADPNVTITLNIVEGDGGSVARLTGAYTSQIGVPGVATFPLQWTTTVSTALPEV